MGSHTEAVGTRRRIIPILAQSSASDADTAQDSSQLVSLYEAHQKIYPRGVSGLFSNWRWALVWATQIVFYGLPWLAFNERQAVLFDLAARRFYIFNLVLYPQDFIYLTGLLVVSALSLFLFTAVAGRLWCGFACPQTVYTEIFMWVEHHIEGDRAVRMKRDKGPWTVSKLLRKTGKHAVWIAIGLWTGFTFVGYFTPIRSLAVSVTTLGFGPWETFWILFYGFATYGNAGWMREQVCKYMCPYARFQSAMFDRDTMIVSYDPDRGETRGSRPRKLTQTEYQATGLGDCIDCGLCVQVCPTGIDIREGLQYECIGCAACVDVCDSIMDKMQYPRGLIRFSTQNGMQQKLSFGAMIRRTLRPRILIYAILLTVLCAGLLVSLTVRKPFRVDVVRDRGSLARIVQQGKLENVYRLQIMNATEEPRTYIIAATGAPGIALASDAAVTVGPAESRWVPVRLQVPPGSLTPGSHAIDFTVTLQSQNPAQVVEKSVFIVPR